MQKFKPPLGHNKDSNPDNSKKPLISKNLDKIDASIKSVRSAIAQTKITLEKFGIKNYDKAALAFRDQGSINIFIFFFLCNCIKFYIFKTVNIILFFVYKPLILFLYQSFEINYDIIKQKLKQNNFSKA